MTHPPTSTAWIVRAGVAAPAPVADASAAIGPDAFVWLHHHMPADSNSVTAGLPRSIPREVLAALMAEETRPRIAVINGGAMLNLRGSALDTAEEGDPLVSIRIWATPGLIVSVSFRKLVAFDTVEQELEAGRILDPGDFVAACANAVARELDPKIAEIGDRLDDIECAIESGSPLKQRRAVTRLRSEAIALRRFLAPQRVALDQLATLEADWLEPGDRQKLASAADRAARMAEELETVRERAAVTHEELTDLRAETLDARSLTIAIIATLFLPLTFITGLFGMNVQGIPWAEHPYGFWIVALLCLATSALILVWFAIRWWIRR